MPRSCCSRSRSPGPTILALCVALAAGRFAQADALDMTGVRALWTYQPSLTGTAMTVAQAEATTIDLSDPNNPVDENDFEVNPAGAQPRPFIIYINSNGDVAYSFPNAPVGTESSHADMVAEAFYLNTTNPSGLEAPAPNVDEVLNYNANYFISNVIDSYTQINASVVNQSFTETSTTPNILLQVYDNYIDLYNTVIVTAAGNSGQVQLPGTAYNVITVSAYGEPVSVGTPDGRSKPDITAPGGATSFSTPVVSGIATLLVQAGRAGLGGAGTQTDATDNRTIKALLLNGATKPQGWSHTSTMPLDPVNGAGIVNADASVHILTAGEFLSVSPGSPTLLPPTGWNRQQITSTATSDATDNYPISLPDGIKNAVFTATLVWDRHIHDTSDNQVTGINNLDLLLVNATTHTQIASSVSSIDNVEQIYFPSITPGTYDVEVLKHAGSAGNPDWVSDSETYSLAWSTTLVGDSDFDGTVGFSDLTSLLQHYGQSQSSTGWNGGDFNGDGTVDFSDFTLLLQNYGATTSSSPAIPAGKAFSLAAAPVPEPGTLAVASASMLLLLRRNRRRRS